MNIKIAYNNKFGSTVEWLSLKNCSQHYNFTICKKIKEENRMALLFDTTARFQTHFKWTKGFGKHVWSFHTGC